MAPELLREGRADEKADVYVHVFPHYILCNILCISSPITLL